MKIKKEKNGWTTIHASMYLNSKVKIKEKDGRFYVTTPSGKYVMFPLLLKLQIETNKDIKCPEGVTIYKIYGESKGLCEEWIKRNCASENDLQMKHKTLIQLIKAANDAEGADGLPVKYNEYEIVKDRLVYEGNSHNQCEIVFKKDDNYYRFEYMYTIFGGGIPVIGQYNSDHNVVDETTYLCRSVEMKQKQVTVVTFE